MGQIKKDIKYLLFSSITIKVIEIIKGFFVLKFLSPEMFGLLNIINQITAFAKYGDLGFISVVEREYNYELEKDKEKAQKIKNVGYSSELVLSVLLLFLVLSFSFFYIEKTVIFVGIVASSVLLFISKILRIYKTDLRLHKNFKSFANFNTFHGVVFNISIIITIGFIGIYSPLIIGVLVSLLVLYIFYKKIDLGFSFLLEKNEVKRQLKIGLGLGGLTFSYGAGMYMERYIVVEKFGLEGVGYLAFGMFFVMSFQQLIYDFARPYMPRTKEELSKGNYDILKKNVVLPTIKIIFPVIAIIIFLQWFVDLMVFLFFEQYTSALGMFNVLILLLIPVALSSFSGYLLYSPGIEKTYHAYVSNIIYIMGLLLCFYFVEITDIVDVAMIFLLVSLVKNLYQVYHILNIIYSKYVLIVLSIIIEGMFILWLL